MFVATLLFFMYIAGFIFLFNKSSFVQKTKIPIKYIAFFFAIKVVAGCVYGYIHYTSNYGAHTDTWKFYYQSLQETALLRQNPILFLQHIFSNGYQDGGTGVMITTNSYWNDLKHNIMLLGMSICNLFSNNNYYVNIVFYNAFTFLGLVAFYRFCTQMFTLPVKVLQAVVFCLPSFVFWSSGFHKEGLLFTALALILFCSLNVLQKRKQILSLAILLLAIVFIFLLRNYILLFFIPMLMTWCVISKYKFGNSIWCYLTTSILIIVLFFTIKLVVPKLDLPTYTATAQNEFLALKANTKLNVNVLQPTFKSFAGNGLQAINTGFLQPNFKALKITYLPSLLENMVIVILILFNFYYIIKGNAFNNTSLLFLCTTVFVFLFLGYTVPIVGAIIRYKAIYLPFLFVALLQRLPWLKFRVTLN
jgi:hypothetical protein